MNHICRSIERPLHSHNVSFYLEASHPSSFNPFRQAREAEKFFRIEGPWDMNSHELEYYELEHEYEIIRLGEARFKDKLHSSIPFSCKLGTPQTQIPQLIRSPRCFR